MALCVTSLKRFSSQALGEELEKPRALQNASSCAKIQPGNCASIHISAHHPPLDFSDTDHSNPKPLHKVPAKCSPWLDDKAIEDFVSHLVGRTSLLPSSATKTCRFQTTHFFRKPLKGLDLQHIPYTLALQSMSAYPLLWTTSEHRQTFETSVAEDEAACSRQMLQPSVLASPQGGDSPLHHTSFALRKHLPGCPAHRIAAPASPGECCQLKGLQRAFSPVSHSDN